jgi:hypothetical protein
VEDGKPLVSYLGFIVPVYHRQRGKRTGLDLEEDDDDSASNGPVAGSSTTSAYRGPANVSADAQHAPKRPRHGIAPLGHIEQLNLVVQLHQSDFGEEYERVRRPFRERTVEAYASGSRNLDLGHVSLLGAGTPFPSPSSGSIPLYGLYDDVDEEYAYASDGDDYEEEDKDEQHDADNEEEVEKVGQEQDDDLATKLLVTAVEVEGGEDNGDNGEGVGAVTDEFRLQL